ncbi:nitrate/nitrite transporter [Kitasatospora sp. NBC_01250]|uniref:nitrate/nitrite transporter n=1 Tax=Kitasatospora sp. NBC_01250 TaxID=2903571 RepID=UPI002E36836C|nr:nitrate/nitrite transporter [Kitasatospora sp. NBC_01250]
MSVVDEPAVSRPRPDLRPGATIRRWTPCDPRFWSTAGRRVAARNLAVSAPALLLATAVWQIWSVLVVELGRAAFALSGGQRFWLAALPGLTGAILRAGYALLGPAVGRRRWTALSTAVLIGPLLGLGLAVRDTGTPYGVLLALAALCGLGGAVASSAQATLDPFYPPALQGRARGRSAGAGDLGIALVQALTPIVITTGFLGAPAGRGRATHGGGEAWLPNAAFGWVTPLALLAVLAWFLMNDLRVPGAPTTPYRSVLRRRHTWLLALLRLGTLGSFLGFAAALPNLLDRTFTAADPGCSATGFVWIGPLVGVLARPLGGRLGRRAGGAWCTTICFAGLALAVIVAVRALPSPGDPGNFRLGCAAFLLLFLFAGLGTGSGLRQLSRLPLGPAELSATAGLGTAVAACGAFFVPAMFALAPATDALYVFVAFYALCLAVCWWCYARDGAPAPG